MSTDLSRPLVASMGQHDPLDGLITCTQLETTAALIAVAVLTLAAGPARAAEDTTGTVTIETMSVAAGLGYVWGKGTLEFRGQRYPFTVKDFNIVDVGVSKQVARGEVYNLKNPEDFEGTFMAAVASGTLGAGAGAAAMQNQKHVRMALTATNVGLNFSLAHQGMHVKFTDEARALAAANRRSPAAEEQPAAAPRPSR